MELLAMRIPGFPKQPRIDSDRDMDRILSLFIRGYPKRGRAPLPERPERASHAAA